MFKFIGIDLFDHNQLSIFFLAITMESTKLIPIFLSYF
ncbi:hypothetical protein FUAX_29350 [Fulvitalea axinellae]|uniref:Uncharacterized protein n=1 Tax=Fulvitalea axinellae TaxID=1182444 RepID=A0AAU9CQY2_9BACT|nr:hypothetical protein FUAX_29350 [Fulvitalea axinellae]